MAIESYVIRGGLEGRERLRVLARVMWPTTEALFARVGVPADARCLDLGCGGGDVSVALATLAPDGSVLGTDLDETKLAMARDEAGAAGLTNVSFAIDDVMEPSTDDARFDVIYARFLLTHLTDPALALRTIAGRLAPGGVLMVEDIDFRGHFCEPECAAFDRYVDWYTRAVQARGADPNIGPRLPGLLAGAGLADVGVNVVQPAGRTGEIKLIAALTLEAVADAVIGAGLASADEVGDTVDALYDYAATDGLMSVPRIVQSWGRSHS